MMNHVKSGHYFYCTSKYLDPVCIEIGSADKNRQSISSTQYGETNTFDLDVEIILRWKENGELILMTDAELHAHKFGLI